MIQNSSGRRCGGGGGVGRSTICKIWGLVLLETVMNTIEIPSSSNKMLIYIFV